MHEPASPDATPAPPPKGHPGAHLHRIRESHRLSLLKGRMRIQIARAMLVGAVAGVVAVLFRGALEFAELARQSLVNRLAAHPVAAWAVFVPLCALCAWAVSRATSRACPEAAGSGIPHLKGVLLHLRAMDWRRLLPVKFAGGALAIGAGLSLGREGPTVQMGAAVGQAVAQALRVPRKSQPDLIAAGAGAGLAAAFNAPLAGFLFVIEELRRDMSSMTYGAALFAAVLGDAATRLLSGQRTSFHMAPLPAPPLSAIPLFLLLGLCAGFAGVLFNRFILGLKARTAGFTPVARGRFALAVGALAGTLLLTLPEAVGSGHATAQAILTGRYDLPWLWTILLPLLLAKGALTVLSFTAGVPGGIFAPLLVLGAATGALVGQAGALLFGSTLPPSALAPAGMAALFCAAVGAPLTGVVLILEMTGGHEQLFAMLVTCAIAFLVAEAFHSRPIYEALLDADLESSGVAPLGGAGHALVDLVVRPGAPFDGRELRHLPLGPGCLAVLHTRAGHEEVPGGKTRLEAGDHVEFVITRDVTGNAQILYELNNPVERA